MVASFGLQTLGILNKQVILQARQRKTIIVQIIITCFFLIFYGWWNLQFGKIGGYIQPPVPISQNTYNSYSNPFAFSLYSIPNNLVSSPGELTNKTGGPKSGMLGDIPQYELTVPYANTKVLVPYFEQMASAEDMDNYLFNLYTNDVQLQNNDEWYNNASLRFTQMLSMPTSTVEFNELDYSDGVLSYYLSVIPNSQYLYFSLYGYLTLPYDDEDSNDAAGSQYDLTMLHGAFLNEATDYNVTLITNAQNMGGNQTSAYIGSLSLLGVITIPPAVTFLLPLIVYTNVVEKNAGLLEMCKIKGMYISAYWIAGFTFYMLLYSLILIATVITLIVANAPLVTASWTLVVPLLIIWGAAQTSLGVFLSTLFKSDRTASIISYGLVFLGDSIAIVINLFLYALDPASWWYYLYPPFVLIRGIYLLQLSYVNPPALTWGTINQGYRHEMWTVFWVLIVQTVVLLVLALYLEEVLPRSSGVRKSPFFPITAIFKKLRPTKSKHTSTNNDDKFEEDEDCVEERRKVMAMSEYGGQSNYILTCKELRKQYTSDKAALRSLCLTVEENECFGLLGPNGAGKTTLISILCGMTKATSGYATIAGHRTDESLTAVQSVIGYCPQHDLVWNDLTIGEHIKFYFYLTGFPQGVARHVAVRDIVDKVGLGDHINKKSSELSGGMKRRLSIAISMVGNPQLLLLDEPTTGLDPESRREIWDIINDACKGRSTIISTHNMEEADVLCTRIGIMSRGRLITIGNQQYLKTKYGQGFHLSITIDPKNFPKVDHFVKKLYPNATMEDNYAGMLSYLIPAQEMNVAQLFVEMRSKKNTLGILEWGINQASLEEVFLGMVRRDEALAAGQEVDTPKQEPQEV